MPSTDHVGEFIHRYTCTIHDGDGCDGHCAVTVAGLISWYAPILADVIHQTPATTLTDFADQISSASMRMTDAGITDAEWLESAAVYLDEAASSTGPEQAAWLKKARDALNGVTDMVDEYRDMPRPTP